tara:strand:+ start:645 stop:908 length:264 start_codon:yes stop_codon:yes gene_type:complete
MALSNFTKETVSGMNKANTKSKGGVSIVGDILLAPLPLNPTDENKKEFPGAFGFHQLDDIDFNDSWDSDFGDTIITGWFKDTFSETT